MFTRNENKSYLLLDERVIEEAKNVRLALGSIEKNANNPLFIEEYHTSPPKRWEPRYDNLYPNVLYDEEEGIFKCWYSPFTKCAVSASTPPGKRMKDNFQVKADREIGVCYAYSKDGIAWIKPKLGIINFNGSKENNIVMLHAHGAGILKDTHETDPKKRYKMLFKEEKKKVMAVAFSADGLQWSDPIQWPEHDIEADTHNNALWVPERNAYVGFTRTWSEGWFKGVRVVARTESSDFINWSKPQIVFQGKDEDDQLYSMPVFRYRNVYLGLPAVLHRGDKSSNNWDKVDTELAWSPDTIEWHRVCPGTPLIPRGKGEYPNGEYDSGCIYGPAYPVVKNDEIMIYYLGSNGMHTHWREGSFNLACMRPDGFAGYEPARSDTEGVVQTKLFRNRLPRFTVNADIVEQDGKLITEVVDENGTVISGFSKSDSDVVKTSVTNHEITWNGKNLSGLQDRTIAFRFILRGAKLYSFGS